MPVYNVTGKLGGGKTLWAVKKAFDALRAGRIVASNVDLLWMLFCLHGLMKPGVGHTAFQTCQRAQTSMLWVW